MKIEQRRQCFCLFAWELYDEKWEEEPNKTNERKKENAYVYRIQWWIS